MSELRKKLRRARETLEAHYIQPKEVKEALKMLRALSKDKSADPRTRKMAAEAIVAHSWEVYEHQNPAVTKVEHSGSIAMPSIIQPVLHGTPVPIKPAVDAAKKG